MLIPVFQAEQSDSMANLPVEQKAANSMLLVNPQGLPKLFHKGPCDSDELIK